MVDGGDHGPPASGAVLAAQDGVVDAAMQELLEGGGAVGVLFTAGDPGVGGVDVVGGAEHGDFGHQLRLGTEQWAGPCGCGGRGPFPCGGADLVGQFSDQLRPASEVLRPFGILVHRSRDGRQPAQWANVGGSRSLGCGQAPVEHGRGVEGVTQRGGGSLVQCGDGVVAVESEQGQVAAQHGPGFGVGDVTGDRGGGLVDAGHGGGASELFGGGGERIGVHAGRAEQSGEGVDFGAGGGGGRDLAAVAAQDRGEDVDRGRRVGGFGREDAVRVGFGGRKVDVVLVFGAGCGDVELLAGQLI